MTTQKAAWASPELHKAPLSPCFRRNYTTPWDTTEPLAARPLLDPKNHSGISLAMLSRAAQVVGRTLKVDLI